MFLGYLPIAALVGLAFPGIAEHTWVVFTLFAIYAISWIAITNVARGWPSPRCGEKFAYDVIQAHRLGAIVKR